MSALDDAVAIAQDESAGVSTVGDDAEAELATLRADLARVTAERDAARAQVRELQKVARAAVAYQEAAFANDERSAAGCELDMFDALTNLTPSMLEEVSDG